VPQLCSWKRKEKATKKTYLQCVQVILENKDDLSDGLPHLIYVSREKKQHQTHNYKAGAMNVLVSFF